MLFELIWAKIKDNSEPYSVLNIPNNSKLDVIEETYQKIKYSDRVIEDGYKHLTKKIDAKRKEVYENIMVQKNAWYRQTEKNKEIWTGIKDQDNPYVVLNIPTNINLDDLADSYKVKEKIDNLIPAMPNELQKLIRNIHLKRPTAYVSIMVVKWDKMKRKDEKDWKRIKDQTDLYKVLDISRKLKLIL